MVSSQQWLLRINLGTILSFVLVKFGLRPLVAGQDYPQFVEVFVFSYPNFCEAIVGTLALTFTMLLLSYHGLKQPIAAQTIYLFALLIAALYVILQEFKIHNLGGENVYDPYDVLFSVIGLATAYFILRWLQPEIVR